jgi:hypothetical protein
MYRCESELTNIGMNILKSSTYREAQANKKLSIFFANWLIETFCKL